MSSPSWQDRRFMFPAGKEVHEGSARRMSGSSATSAESPVLTSAVPVGGAAVAGATPAMPEYPVVEKKILSNPDAWGGDRRFMGRTGKEVHEPARRLSASSASKPVMEVPKSSSPPAQSSGGGIAAAIAGRRRVSHKFHIPEILSSTKSSTPHKSIYFKQVELMHICYFSPPPLKAACSPALWQTESATRNDAKTGQT